MKDYFDHIFCNPPIENESSRRNADGYQCQTVRCHRLAGGVPEVLYQERVRLRGQQGTAVPADAGSQEAAWLSGEQLLASLKNTKRYCLICYELNKHEEQAFLAAMDELYRNLLIKGYRDYEECYNTVFGSIKNLDGQKTE